MLYNPNWKPETKPDVFSLESLISWLETMPGRKRYDYSCTGHCLIGQYVRSIDPAARFWDRAGPDDLYKYVVGGRLCDLKRFHRVASNYPRTFGAALERARAALVSQGKE